MLYLKVLFKKITGELFEHNKLTSTDITSTGGGGVISSGKGVIRDVEITSKLMVTTELWIREDDGIEKSIQFKGDNIPLRNGQKITLIYACKQGSQHSQEAVLVNHATNNYHLIRTAQELNFVTTTWLNILVGIGASVLVMKMLPVSGARLIIAPMVGVACGYGWGGLEKIKVSMFCYKLNDHLHLLGKTILEKK